MFPFSSSSGSSKIKTLSIPVKYTPNVDYGFPSGTLSDSSSSYASMGNDFIANKPLLINMVGTDLSASGVGIAYDACVAVLDNSKNIMEIRKKAFTGVDGLNFATLDEPVLVLEGTQFWVGITRTDGGGTSSTFSGFSGGTYASEVDFTRIYPRFVTNNNLQVGDTISSGGIGFLDRYFSFGSTTLSSLFVIPITNAGFETGDATGWTLQTGAADVVDWFATGGSVADPVGLTASRNGTYIFNGGNQPDLVAYQEVDITSYTAATAFYMTADLMSNFTDSDNAQIWFEQRDAIDTVLSTSPVVSLDTNQNIAVNRLTSDIKAVGATKIRLFIRCERVTGTSTNASIDNIQLTYSE